MIADLESYVVNRSLVTATWYGEKDGRPFVTTEYVAGSDLRRWMAALPESRGRLWLDVCGYDSECFTALADALGKPVHELMDDVLMQDARFDLVLSAKNAPSAELILHSRELSLSPIVPVPASLGSYFPPPLRGVVNWIVGHKEEDDGILAASDLLPRKDIVDTAPAISLEQLSMIIADEKTLVTLRLPAFKDAESDLEYLRSPPPVVAASSEASVYPVLAHPGLASSRVTVNFAESADPLAHDPSLIRRCFDQVRLSMALNSPTVEHAFKSSAKALAIVITDSLLQQNHHLRDSLLDWEHVLARSIKKEPGSLHLPHLEAISTITGLYTNRIQQLCEILDPAGWDRDVGDSGDAPSLKRAYSKVAVNSGASLEEVAASRAARSMMHGTPAKRGPSSQSLPTSPSTSGIAEAMAREGGLLRLSSAPESDSAATLTKYFGAFLEDFTELSKDLRSVLLTLESKQQKIESLRQLLQGLKADSMNRTLYALTVLTAVSVPITFLTGLFGMNFEDMYELFPKYSPTLVELEDKYGTGHASNYLLPVTGYRFFWAVLVAVISVQVSLMYRQYLVRVRPPSNTSCLTGVPASPSVRIRRRRPLQGAQLGAARRTARSDPPAAASQTLAETQRCCTLRKFYYIVTLSMLPPALAPAMRWVTACVSSCNAW